MSEPRAYIAILPEWPIDASWAGQCGRPAVTTRGARVAVQAVLTESEAAEVALVATHVYGSTAANLWNAKQAYADLDWTQFGYVWGYEIE